MTPTRRADLLQRFAAAGEIATHLHDERKGAGEPSEIEAHALEEQDAAEFELALAYLESRHG
ncbi:MAG: hypothetical protein JNL96_14385 [Planctomycetaceae bacterium]|nr:hypothetical protein [Planctomycetaceae bacterium]